MGLMPPMGGAELSGSDLSAVAAYVWALVVLSPVVAVLFLTGRNVPLCLLPFYWLTVVAIRAAGTAVGDFLSGRNLLDLSMSTLATGLLLLAILIAWKEPATAK